MLARPTAVGMAVGLVAVLAPASSPAVVIPTGWAVIKVDEGCLARVIRGDYRLAVPGKGRMELPVGKYKLKVRPATCTRSKKTFRIRKGKTIRASVVSAEPVPPTTQ